MEGLNFLEIVKLFFKYGPFAILPFLFIVYSRAAKQLNNALKEKNPVLERSISFLKGEVLFYKVLIILLIVVCLVFWFFVPPGPTYYYGEITELNSAQHVIKSSELHLRNSSRGGFFIIDWIWKRDKNDKYAKIILEYAGTDGKLHDKRSFYIYPDELERCKCTFKFNTDYGILIYNGRPLCISPRSTKTETAVNKDTKSTVSSGMALLYAGPIRPSPDSRDIDSIITQLQALDSAIRDLEVENLVNSASRNRRLVLRVLKRGFDMLNGCDQQQPLQQELLYNKTYLLSSLLITLNNLPDKFFKDWSHLEKSLGIQATGQIIEATTNRDSNIKNLALSFLLRLPEDKKEYQQILNKLPRSAFPNKHGMASSFELSENLSQKQREVLNTALKLKEEILVYKWGGKDPRSGIDSSGFVAYIFNKAGLIEKPGTWYPSKMREELGDPRTDSIPSEPGDLVFYKRGYVMLFLGDNKIIGMTERGVVITDYREFLGDPIQVNKYNYR